jgi:hypothetical protein
VAAGEAEACLGKLTLLPSACGQLTENRAPDKTADVNRPRTADDFATVRARTEGLRREREGAKPARETASGSRPGRAVGASAGRRQRPARGREGSGNLARYARKVAKCWLTGGPQQPAQ